MRFQYGLIGAILGAIVGGAATVLIVSITANGDDFGTVFGVIFFGPIGLLVGAILGIVLALCLLPYIHGAKGAKIQPRTKTLLVVSLLVGSPALAIGMLLGAGNLGNPPSDSQLLTNFQQHRATFDMLARMVQADKGVKKIDDASMGSINVDAPNVPPARIAAYRRLMTSVGIARGFEAIPQTGEIDFLYYANGSAISDDITKGYVYLTKPPKNLRTNLDQCETGGENPVQAYRHIEGNWYLFYEFLPG